MVKRRSMTKFRSRSRNGGKIRARSMRRSRRMRGGRLSGQSSYSTLISSSGDNNSYLAGQNGDFQQNIDRNNSLLSTEGDNVNMSQFKGLTPPGAYYGGKRSRRKRRMRGGDDSEAAAVDNAVSNEEDNTDLDHAQTGGRRRRRRRMRGGMYDPPQGPSGGTRQKRRGGGVIATAALPFGLFGLQKYFQGNRSQNVTRRHRRRRS